MANLKITGLTELATSPALTDLLEIVDVSDTTMAASGTNKKITVSNFLGAVISGTTDRIVKFTSATSIGNSNFAETGTAFYPVAAGNLGTASNKFTSAHISTSIIASTTDFDFNVNSSVRMKIKSSGELVINGSIVSGILNLKTTGSTPTTFGLYQENAGGAQIFKQYSSGQLALGLNSDESVYIGNNAGLLITSAGNSVGIGFNALQALTTGNRNTVLGSRAASLITTGAFNTAIGYEALKSNVSANFNVAVGDGVLRSCTGGNNTSVGGTSGFVLTTGTFNNFFGQDAGAGVTTGFNNSCFGYLTMQSASTISNSIAIGNQSGSVATTGSNLIFFGNNTSLETAGTFDNSICIGREAKISASNQFVTGADGKPYINYYFGAGTETAVAQVPNTVNIRMTSIKAGVTDSSASGKDLYIYPAAGTGTGIGGDFVIKSAPPQTTGSTQNTFVDVLKIKGTTDTNVDIVTNRGSLIVSRLTTTERDTLTAINGMIIYNTTTSKFQGYEAGSWTNLI